ncbi:MAG: flagellar basal body P-ring protein FlgI, partial [Selenomonadaceae bacterium]|nr:flagellar basal body P-ring protein FlgI [Selenomonadaceae bacterium]
KDYDVIQPPPFSHGNTVILPDENVDVQEQTASSIVLPATSNINDIVGALNSVGATPRDIISILQAIKASGALHADLELI